MQIIILSHEQDDHAAPIRWALEQAGYRAACWDGLSFTPEQQASLFFEDQPNVILGSMSPGPGDVIWMRQYNPPTPDPAFAERDAAAASLEYDAFFDSILSLLDLLPVRCVNSFSSARRIGNKALQLFLAKQSGLKIPRTLMANCPAAVRKFFGGNDCRIICKPYTPHLWQTQDQHGMAVAGTFELDVDQLPRDEVLTFSPGIYQEMVNKQFDVRTVLMGRRIYSYALHTPHNALDWRHDGALGNIEVERITTPHEVEQAILAFAELSGICFGSLDFAIDATGVWWFLEINEQGQFLWLDHFCPGARMQEKFCAFLTAPEEFTGTIEERAGLFPSFSDYQKSGAVQKTPKFTAAPGPRSYHRSLEP